VEDGDQIACGTVIFDVLHTPGHTPGGISLVSGGHVFVGDTLFAGSVGRTDFPGGSFEALRNSIRNKLFKLDDSVRVYTGHGPETSIGEEKRNNPFVGQRATYWG
jgi:hydroxyacylglutathione hydrolase